MDEGVNVAVFVGVLEGVGVALLKKGRDPSQEERKKERIKIENNDVKEYFFT